MPELGCHRCFAVFAVRSKHHAAIAYLLGNSIVQRRQEVAKEGRSWYVDCQSTVLAGLASFRFSFC